VFALGYNYDKFIGNRADSHGAESTSRRADNPSGVTALSDANSMSERKPGSGGDEVFTAIPSQRRRQGR